jgi:hypothetical protein
MMPLPKRIRDDVLFWSCVVIIGGALGTILNWAGDRVEAQVTQPVRIALAESTLVLHAEIRALRSMTEGTQRDVHSLGEAFSYPVGSSEQRAILKSFRKEPR